MVFIMVGEESKRMIVVEAVAVAVELLLPSYPPVDVSSLGAHLKNRYD